MTPKFSKTCRGVSLVEMLIVFAVFSVVTLMVADMSRLALFSQASTTDKVEARRQATTFLGKMRREFGTCRALANPDPNVGSPSDWTPLITNRLILHINASGGTRAIGYWLDPNVDDPEAGGVIWRQTTTESKPVLRGVESFEFEQTPGPGAHIMKVKLKMKVMPKTIEMWGRAVRV